MRRDLLCAGLLLALAVIFWFQQDYTTPVDAVLPRFVLVVLAVLGVAIGAAALLRSRRGREGTAQAAAPARTDAEGVPGAGAAVVGPDASPAVHGDGSGGADGGEDAPVDRRVITAAILLLLGWGAAFGLFGLAVSGVVAFVATAALVKRGFTPVRGLLVDTGVAIGFVLLCFFVFTRVLYVPLPVSVLLGI
ncbi:hypothetical protein HDA32_003013 [Spinactinospora alkalitolerans]|uniref:DUF1468 domain-containing protein n=1 Tax=Spinactinospora alkalitolerans TaxID=687207 RepID=A0A852TYM1_9ACTN|nr:tripartite tricarboxylate transporter TctB family protein [Spinactinospora alkalitolerans]NYE47893.1 hypothetical protein [Spinactinospora alkalitolerans]